MNGHEVARRIRKRPELDHLTLIAITGWGQAEGSGSLAGRGLPAPSGQARQILPSLQALLAALEAERHTTKW